MIKKWLKTYFNNSGMSLVEVMVLLGVTTTISLGFVRLIDTQSKAYRSTKIQTEENTMFERIDLILKDGENCMATISDDGGNPFIVSTGVGTAVGRIKLKNDAVVYALNEFYGSNSFQIISINLIDIDGVTGSGNPAPNVDVYLDVTTRRVGEKNLISENKSQKFTLRVDLDAADRVTSCYSNNDADVDAAMIDSCNAVGGNWNAGTNQCEFSCDLGAVSDVDILSANCLMNDGLTNIEARYINMNMSDTITGNTNFSGFLTVNGNITSGNINVRTAVINNDVIIGGSVTLDGSPVATTNQLFQNLPPASKDAILGNLVTAASSQTGVNAMSQSSREALNVTTPSCPSGEAMRGLSYDNTTGTFTVNCGSVGTGGCPAANLICAGTTYNSGDGYCSVAGTKNCCPPASEICTGDTYNNAGAGCNVVGTKTCITTPARQNQNFTQTRSRASTGGTSHCGCPVYNDWGSWSAGCASLCTNGTTVNTGATSCTNTVSSVVHHCGFCHTSNCVNESRTLTCECDI